MPKAIYYVPPTSPDRNGFTQEVTAERTNRRKAYRTALDYYLGKHDAQLEIVDDVDDNTTRNLVKLTADRTVSFLFPNPPTVETDPSSVNETPEEKWLREFFMHNGGLSSLSKLTLNGFLSGHCFVRIKPDSPYPRMVILDPTSTTIYWRANDSEEVLWYEQRYRVGDTPYITDFVRINSKSWRIHTYRQKPQVAIRAFPSYMYGDNANLDYLDFEAGGFELVETAVWDAPFPPIIEWEHLPHPDSRYGLGEFTQKELQDSINRIASTLQRIVRENGDPVDVITGADVDEVQNSGEIMTVPSPDARVTRLQISGDLGAITSALDRDVLLYLAVARVVLLNGGASELQRVTNTSVRTLFVDMLAKNALLQDAYGDGLRRISATALAIGVTTGQVNKVVPLYDIYVKFGSALPVDMTEIANVNALALNGGYMDKRTAAENIGLDWQFVKASLAEEHPNDNGDDPNQDNNDDHSSNTDPSTPLDNGVLR
jgi:hypothetical protein